MRCKHCGKPVEFRTRWVHSDGSDEHEPYPVKDVVHTTTPTEELSIPDGEVDEPDGSVAYALKFLEHYYTLPGLDWREVRAHDRGHACHCPACKPVCKVCLARKEQP